MAERSSTLRSGLRRRQTELVESLDVPSCPYYHLVPKGFEENLRFRRRMIEYGSRGDEQARELWIMSKRDPLFYMNTFVWTYDPRLAEEKRVPFITFDFQDALVLSVLGSLGHDDLVVEKSRDEGASLCCVMSFEWRWHFYPMETFLLVSRKRRLVQSDDPKSLFYKIDFAHELQPGWLLPQTRRMKGEAGHLKNLDNGSTIDGESTTGDVAAGDRRTGILLDEFARVEQDYEVLASTRDVTRTRIYNSSPQGQGNAFYELTQDPQVATITVHWSQDPRKNDGLYTADSHGNVQTLDPDYDYSDYNFKTKTPGGEALDGLVRSPWYDREVARAVHHAEIAQELDIDYLGSSYQFFDMGRLQTCEQQDVMPPLHVGRLDYDIEPVEPSEWIERTGGPFKLWTNLDASGNVPPGHSYAVGCDVAATGTASFSCMSIVDIDSGEKVGEWASHNIMPHEFAPLAVATCKYFHGAKLIWEANGPGQEFSNCVIDLGYSNIFYRMRSHDKEAAGWYSTTESKRTVLGDYRRSLGSKFVNRSEDALAQCRQYVFLSSGKIEHSSTANSPHPTEQGSNHGDMVVADALACKLLLAHKEGSHTPSPEVPENSLAHRRQQAASKDKDYY